MKFTMNLLDLTKFLLKYSDSEDKFHDHIIVKSSIKFFQMHKEYMKEELTGTILLEYLLEHFEVAHPYFKLYLANFCKNYNKFYPVVLALNNFLQKLTEANHLYSTDNNFKELVIKLNHIKDVTEFYYEFLNKFKNNEFRTQTIVNIYKNFPIKKNLYLFSNKELFEKIRYNFFNQVE